MDEGQALTGKTAIITGGVGALGRAVVACFQEAGANVVVVDRPGTMASVQASDRVLLVEADLLDEGDTARMVEAARGRFGRVDALVCLVGGFFGDTPVVD
ncbi:MAG: SDR family NAD(P)-dependent oxidoreductase, partial [Dehalococcoidia bacterium]